MKKTTSSIQPLRLLILLGFVALSFAIGLYLSFIKDYQHRAQVSADLSLTALIRYKNSASSENDTGYTQRVAYEALMDALALAPYEPILWMRMADVLSFQEEKTPGGTEEARAIAAQLKPALGQEINRKRQMIRTFKALETGKRILPQEVSP